MERVNFVEFACGMRASGKSTLLARHAARFPRRLIIDPIAEYWGVYKGAIECLSLPETLDALGDLVKVRRWTIVACLEPADTVKLCGMLAPLNNPRAGYSISVDGLLLECGEVDTIAPNSKAIPNEIKNLFQRGRHYRVSVVCATQRPRDVHRVVTSQADVISCFRQHEPRDVDYLASLTTSALAARIATLEPYAHLQFLPRVMRAFLVDSKGKEVKLDPLTATQL